MSAKVDRLSGRLTAMTLRAEQAEAMVEHMLICEKHPARTLALIAAECPVPEGVEQPSMLDLPGAVRSLREQAIHAGALALEGYEHVKAAEAERDATRERRDALLKVLKAARDIAYRMYGDVEEPGDHYEECPAADEDAHEYRVHASNCEAGRAGQRMEPCAECCGCDAEFERDADEMLSVCDCHVKELHELVVMADAAIAAAEGRER